MRGKEEGRGRRGGEKMSGINRKKTGVKRRIGRKKKGQSGGM